MIFSLGSGAGSVLTDFDGLGPKLRPSGILGVLDDLYDFSALGHLALIECVP